MAAAKGRRIAFFDAYPHVLAGAQLATLRLMRGLRERGWSVHLGVPGDGPFVAAARREGFDVTLLPLPGSLGVYGRRTTGPRAVAAVFALPIAWARIARWLRSTADIAHVADHRGQVLCGPAARLCRLPVVWHVHAVITGRAINTVGAALATRVLTPNRAAARRMNGIEWRRPTTVVPYAIDGTFLACTERRPATPPVVLASGRLHPDKAFDVLLKAVALIRTRVDFRVQILGEAQQGLEDYERELHALRQQLGLEDIVEFVGYAATPLTYLEAATVYVQPSRDRTEIQPLAILEAMAVGVPVLATTTPTLTETLGDGEFGTLVPPDDVDALADALLHLLNDPSAAHERASAARARVHETATTSRMVTQVEDIYRTL